MLLPQQHHPPAPQGRPPPRRWPRRSPPHASLAGQWQFTGFRFHAIYGISAYSCLVFVGLALGTVLISSEISANLSLPAHWMRINPKKKMMFNRLSLQKKLLQTNATLKKRPNQDVAADLHQKPAQPGT